uniref:Uncharacterized protein n=1 Tax=Ascaris lumbricoides TaxID=6252 RepID=A0A0M3IXI8_ASCLU
MICWLKRSTVAIRQGAKNMFLLNTLSDSLSALFLLSSPHVFRF